MEGVGRAKRDASGRAGGGSGRGFTPLPEGGSGVSPPIKF
jgi:hypothetical protein